MILGVPLFLETPIYKDMGCGRSSLYVQPSTHQPIQPIKSTHQPENQQLNQAHIPEDPWDWYIYLHLVDVLW